MAEWRTVLITGASAGIGAAYARALAPRSRRLMLVGRRSERLASMAGELAGDDREVDWLAVDLATPLGVTRVVEWVRQSGPVELLINNAGLGVYGHFGDGELEAQLDMVRVHVDATLALTRAVLPGMREQGGGAIVNVSSIVALSPYAGSAVYGGSKAFLNNFSEALQQEEADHGIRVQCLCPGYTRTDFHQRDAFRGFDADQVPEKWWMTPEDVVAESLAALAGDEVVVVPGAANRARWGPHDSQ